MPDVKPRNLTTVDNTSLLKRYLPWAVLSVGVIAVLLDFLQPREEAMHVHEFGSIAVIDSGRFKPFDSFARDALFPKAFRHTVPIKLEGESEETLEATPWLLEVMATGLARYYSLVSIPNPEIQEFLGLQPRPNDTMFEIAEIPQAGLKKLFDLAQNARTKQIKELSPLDQERIMTAFEIASRGRKAKAMEAGLERLKIHPIDLKLFRIENDQILAILGLKPRSGLRYSYREIVKADGQGFLQFRRKVEEAKKRESSQRDLVDNKALQLADQLSHYMELSNLGGIKIVPGPKPEQWQTLGSALLQESETGRSNPQANALADLLYYYAANKPDDFNTSLAKYLTDLNQEQPAVTRTLGLELFYNDVNPFYLVLWFYVFVFVLLCLSWFGWESDTVRRSALFLGVLALAIHTWGMGTRMMIQGRPPVTNLYSSALFIGWGCVILAVGMELFFRNTFALLVGSILGFLTLLVAPYMLEDGKDSMAVLVAVLDTNFWLATHVICITLGYTTTLLAGVIGVVYIVWGVCTGLMTKEVGKVVGYMLYGVLCFATLLSFVGTVLGGIWADQSWGRFWGWDPKENGAVMIVIWNALILHARWGGMVKERGMAMLALVGNMITAWSWAGTNQLGVGLHAYGFNKTLATMLVIVWAFHLVILGIAMIPQRYWLSFRPSYEPKMTPIAPFKRSKRSRETIESRSHR